MNMQDIEQRNIKQRYLTGRLNAQEVAAFEEYMLDKPELTQELELDSILYKTMPECMEQQPAIATNTMSSRRNQRLRQTLNASWKYALAAGLGAFLFGPMVHSPLFSPAELARPAALTITGNNQIAYLETTRSMLSADKTIELGATASQLILLIQPATMTDSEFAVSLQRADTPASNAFATQATLANNGDLIISVPTDILQPATYALTIQGVRSDFSQTFSFNLVQTP